MKIFSLKRNFIALTFLFAAVFTSTSTTLAAPKIEWSPSELQFIFAGGAGGPLFATFTSSEPLDQVTFEVVPALSDFVTIQPTTLQNVPAGVPQTIVLNFSLPPGTEPGTFGGVLLVRSGKRVIPQPLKITIIVEENQDRLLLGTDMPTTNTDAEVAVTNFQTVAQQFTLTSPVHLSSINLQMSGFGVDQFTVWVTNAIGQNTTQANVLFQTNATFPNTGGGINGATVSVPTDLDLAPGTYFIVLSSTQNNVLQGWLASNVELASTVGEVGAKFFTFSSGANPAFPPAGAFSSIEPRPQAFQLFGSG